MRTSVVFPASVGHATLVLGVLDIVHANAMVRGLLPEAAL
jgi:hypothetical protein